MWDSDLVLGFLPFGPLPFLKGLAKDGRRRCPPLGAFNPPPTEGVRSVLDNNHIAFRYVQIISQRANLRGQALYASLGSCSPLFFSPQEPGDHRRPWAKKRKSVVLWLFFSMFCPSKLQSKFCIEKMTKKMLKS